MVKGPNAAAEAYSVGADVYKLQTDLCNNMLIMSWL